MKFAPSRRADRGAFYRVAPVTGFGSAIGPPHLSPPRCRQHQELKGQPGGRHRCRFPHRPDHRSHLPMRQGLQVHYWGQAHRQLWDKLRHAGRAVEVFAVAWDPQHLDRTQRLLQTWTRGPPPLLSWPLPGLGMIDSFRLWGWRRCRRIGVHFTSVGLATWTGHDFDNHNASLSEGGALAVGVRDFSETPHGTRDNTDFPRPMRKSDARLRLACPPLARRAGAPHERGAGGGSDPPTGRGDGVNPRAHHLPLPVGAPASKKGGSLPP